ncbi:cation diffusion facilitator family transporter [Hahella ganghwensis]|uniref:cation diffusion facilitator family transporter n=1 Tax=Hahella ganghwensis TaxID=286420 RepID=UPI000375D452|nr:cation diffusion facilitator family transporter [Hahella ganghwensis]
MAGCCEMDAKQDRQRRLLWMVLILNGGMFVVELIAGLIAQSTGLLADSLDMLADAAVYAISLYAVGRAASVKITAAQVNGIFQLTLGIGVLIEIGRRIWLGSTPDEGVMMSVALAALLVNITCFVVLYSQRQGDINIRAAWICSRNDMLANVGVIAAAALVSWSGEAWPDWVIGGVIALLVIHSSIGILREARQGKMHSCADTACSN